MNPLHWIFNTWEWKLEAGQIWRFYLKWCVSKLKCLLQMRWKITLLPSERVVKKTIVKNSNCCLVFLTVLFFVMGNTMERTLKNRNDARWKEMIWTTLHFKPHLVSFVIRKISCLSVVETMGLELPSAQIVLWCPSTHCPTKVILIQRTHLQTITPKVKLGRLT